MRLRRDAAPGSGATSSRARRREAAEADRSRRAFGRFALTTGSLLTVAFVALLGLPAVTGEAPMAHADVAAVDHPRLGSGPVEVAVFSDFQCPACAAVAPVLSQLADEGSISLVYRYFPLVTIHANATAAAEAAEAAGRQGRFWEFHDALFAGQEAWADLPSDEAAAAFESIAGQVDLDVDRWRADVTAPEVADVVADDRRASEGMALSGTPTIFVEGVQYRGTLSRDGLVEAIEAATAP